MAEHNRQPNIDQEAKPDRYGLLARVSTQAQADKDLSIPAQEAKMREYVSSQGGTVEKVYADAGVSGTTDQRNALQEAVTDAKAGRFDVLLVHKSDRFFRSQEHAMAYKILLRQHGIRLRSVTEPWFGGNSATDKLQEGVMAAISEFYTDNLKTEIRKGHEQAVKVEGRQIGFPPYGYKRAEPSRKGSEWVVDDEAATWVRWMFDRVLAGDIVAEIAKKLNDLDVPTYFSRRSVNSRPNSSYLPEGRSAKVGSGLWRPGTVSLMLLNPIYKGVVTYNKKEYPGHHEAIIAEDTWNQVNRLLQSRGKKRAESSKRGLFVGGLLRCPFCGYPLHFRQARNRAAILAERRGEKIDDWPEERRWSDGYNCSRYHEIALAERMNAKKQSDYMMNGPVCEGFSVSANTVKRLLIEHITQIIEITAALPTRMREIDEDENKDAAPSKKARRVRVVTEEQRREDMKDHLRRSLEGIVPIRKKYQRMAAEGLTTLEELREALEELEEKRRRWQSELDTLEAIAHISPPGILPSENASTLLAILTDENLPIRQKRDALRVALKYIVIHPGKKSLTIHL